MTLKKTKRRLNGKAVAIISASLLIILTVIKVPILMNDRKLKALGYSKEAMTALKEKGLRSTVLKNKYFSDYLNEEIVKDDFRKDYLKLYLVSDHVNDDYLFMYERVRSLKGYSEEEMLEIYSELNYYDMLALCVFDSMDSERLQSFIEDAKAHPSEKNAYHFTGSYLDYSEEKGDPLHEADAIEVLVNKGFTLDQYAPEKLVSVSQMNAIPGIQLESRALEAFDALCKDLREHEMAVYAVQGYRSYDTQKELYISDESLAKAGHDERQTGLSVAIVSSENESASRFNETAAFTYLKDHAHEFGFIFRYPEGKKAVTGFDSSDNYLRFVGTELAGKIHSAQMSYEEYFALYLLP